jgi:threonine dehydratase
MLYRFEFPERPGALTAFVDELNPHWNISIFHYRNQGSDVGRIVVGVQVPQKQLNEWQQFLNQLDVPFTDETNNPAYQLFLA